MLRGVVKKRPAAPGSGSAPLAARKISKPRRACFIGHAWVSLEAQSICREPGRWRFDELNWAKRNGLKYVPPNKVTSPVRKNRQKMRLGKQTDKAARPRDLLRQIHSKNGERRC